MAGKVKIDVDHIAALARLELDDAEKLALQDEMGEILNYVDLLNELDVSGIEPTAHAALMVNVMRDDKASESAGRKPMLANAPATVDDELVKVPKVIE